ncbi:unnamed protein product, partial [Adineta steineri]
MPPRTLATSNGTKEAYIHNACLQEFDFGIQRTEACLTLNVYAPENATNLPVFVWIHGGGFFAGSGAEYNSMPFVSTSMIHSVPVVTVTINYRQGLFGFLADEELYGERSGMDNRKTTGNYGILDQIMALDWIKKNIAGFGGNPEQTTVGGESGGGISITILLTSSLVSKGTFQRVIVQSGSMWPAIMDTLQEAINNTGNVLRTITNCTTVQCLRNLTGNQILTAQHIITSKRFMGIPAVPVIDGYVVDDILENYYARGNFQKVPILIGSTANETASYTYRMFGDKVNSTQVQEFLKTLYNATIIDEIPTIYGPISAFDNPFTYLNIIYTDAWILCEARRIAAKFSSYGLPTYLYTYNHLVSAAPSWAGVTHGVELPMLFPTILSYYYRNYTFTTLDQQLSSSMMLYWAHFIYNSNPNYNGNPANWDTYLASTDSDFVVQIKPHMRNHYYYPTCSRLLGQPQMMVVSDLEEIFVPLLEAFLCSPHDSRGVINSLLDQIPQTFANSQETETILALVIQAGIQALKEANCSGKIYVFSTTMPIAMAPGKLSNREDKKALGTEKEKTLLSPVNNIYTKLGEVCAQNGCVVDLFVFPNNYYDLATIGEVCRISGGEIYKFNYFSIENDRERLLDELKRNFQRTTAFDALMRVRTSTGIGPIDFLGNFYMTNATEMIFGTIDSDKSVSVELKHEDKLPDDGNTYTQVALLYTSISGQRRLRIITLALTVTSSYITLYPACDLDTIMNYITKV